MTDRPRNTTPVRAGKSLDAAVRRAVGMRFAPPSLRSMLRACSVYANVIAALVALGLPGGGLRLAAGSAVQAFESAVRASRESVSGIPDFLSAPADLTAVTECARETADPAPCQSTDTEDAGVEPTKEAGASASPGTPPMPESPQKRPPGEPDPLADNPESVR